MSPQNRNAAIEYWVLAGKVGAPAAYCAADAEQECACFGNGLVRVITGEAGTEFKWDCHSPSVASLFAVADLIPDWNGPYVLRYNLQGWVEERLGSSQETRTRVLDIISRCDRRIASPVMVKSCSLNEAELPPLLSRVLELDVLPQEHVIDCVCEPLRELFLVERIGPETIIGRIFGTSVNSNPCVATGAYGRAISNSYMAALENGNPQYEQVMASLVLPDNSRHWMPYHRLVFPVPSAARMMAVKVVSEIAPVSLRIV
jgi:hypothetical protein